jgi:hypothetical protein
LKFSEYNVIGVVAGVDVKLIVDPEQIEAALEPAVTPDGGAVIEIWMAVDISEHVPEVTTLLYHVVADKAPGV